MVSKNTIENLPTVLHVKDLVPLLSISQNTAYALVRSGQIRSIRIGRTYRIPKPLTVQNYKKQVEKHLKPALGAAKLEALDSHTIQRFYNSLSEDGLAPKTVKNIHGVLHSALEQAISNDYIHRNPTEACKLPKVVKLEIHPLEPTEISKLLQEAEKDDYENLFIVAMFTGMRQGELLGLAWDTARFHDLRHSFAVTSLYAGDDIKTVQANLGHATAQFTLDVYGHVTQKMRKDSANRMQQFYDQIKASQNAP